MKLRSALLTATLLATPAVAMAQPVDGLYVGAGAGYNYLQDLKLHGSLGKTSGSGKLEGDGGFAGSGSIGYGLGNGFRLEVQGDYKQDHQKLKSASFGVQGGDGDTQSYGAYLNALYDFDIGSSFVFPYVGVGAGYRWTQLHSTTAYIPAFADSFSGNNNSKGGFSAQGMVGAAFPFPGMPGLSITAEYRFTGVFEKETFGGSVSGADFPTPTHASFKTDDQYNHSVLIGLRYAFNVPSPPPPPAPAPAMAPVAAPARTYLVFFDWDRADLTARAKQIIGEAAANATHVQVTRIMVNGYTDLSGTPAYNQKLSVRRAESVAAELVKDGISRSEITTMGFGETHPLVPTAQGVREPQNRRVEIILK